MRIRRRMAGEILMSMGIGCGLAYILVNLSSLPPSLTRFSGMLLYASIVALSSGLLFYLLTRVDSPAVAESALSRREGRSG
ncbi:MAG TPA: hypothetical protein VF717_19240 [Pyrinomonadaceae bacterium]|jgi:hypothetical protein